jgi:hypothetical protein
MVAAAMGIKGLRAPIFVLKLVSAVIGVLTLLIIVPLIEQMRLVVCAPFHRGDSAHERLTSIFWLIAFAIALEAVLVFAFNYKP